MRFVKIPLDRVGVLIGPKGVVKDHLEKQGGTLTIDSTSGEVRLEYPDSLVALQVDSVVRAIGRGFSPEQAMRLLNEGVYFELLDIHDCVGKNPRHVKRVSGRVIGTGGKTRRIIEEMTNSRLSIYGHTIGIIGDLEDVTEAKKALDMLLTGAPHPAVYRFLEKANRPLPLQSL